MLCAFIYTFKRDEKDMDENTTLVNVSKKSKFLWLYVIIIIIILILIVLFVFVRTNDVSLNDQTTSQTPDGFVDNNSLIIDNNSAFTEEIPFEIIYAENPENCGTNINCFKEYSAACKEGSRFLFTDTIETENKLFTRTTEYTIKGIEYIYCKVSLSLYDINVEITGEDNFNESMVSKEDIGTAGTCYFNTPQALLDYLDLKEKDAFNGSVDCFYLDDNSTVCSSTGDMVNNSCEGPYFMLQYK